MLKQFLNYSIKIRSILIRRGKVTMAESENVIMVQRPDPSTGELGWAVEDETYDYHQEIARSAFADMLHDSERNDKYYEGIKAAIKQKHDEGKKAHVLDIGTGTGLLAMMAARCGADTIHACEAFSPISQCAEKVIEENGLSDRITVIHKRSTAMTVSDDSRGLVGDLPRRCNILVTEVFDTELIGEGAIATFNHAHTHLLEKDCLVVPSGGTVFAQVVESDWMQRWNRLAPWGEVALTDAITECPGAAAVHDLQLSQLRLKDFRALTLPQPVFRFDWTCRTGLIPVDDTSIVSTKAVASGTAQMVFMWWSLDMDPKGEIELSCAPWWAHPSCGPDTIPWRDHWMQAVYYLALPLPVCQWQTLELFSSHDEYSMWFNLDTGGSLTKLMRMIRRSASTEQIKRPVCDCMLHVTCSRTRIGMLNDPARRVKYEQVLRRLVTPQSVVLSCGDTSLLGLVAATMGADKVYHYESNPQSKRVMHGLIQKNNLQSKVTILSPNEPPVNEKDIILSANLVIGEPYLMSYPSNWYIRWFMMLQTLKTCPDTVRMPASLSLCAMPVQFDHLHKIHAPLNTINGFKMTPFDELIQGSSAISDSRVELQPLWEYPGVCLAKPSVIYTLDSVRNFTSMGNMQFVAPGTWHAMVIWVDIHLDSETTVSTGPEVTPVPGQRICWDPYTRQQVYFMMPEVSVVAGDFLQYNVVFDPKKGEEVDFRFNLQEEFKLKPKT